MRDRLRVAFVTTGYPSADRPNQNIFLHRSIKTLSQYFDPQIIYIRSWLPGRPVINNRKLEDIPVQEIYIPQFPFGGKLHLNAVLLSFFGKVAALQSCKSADIIHSTELYPAGFVASQWALKLRKPHTTHVTGSDLNLFLIPKLRYIDRGWINKIKGVACNSRAIQESLSIYIPELRNVNVIYRGVNTERYTPTGETSGPLAKLPPLRFMYLGGFHTWNPCDKEYYNIKGGHTLLEAWRRMEAELTGSTLLVGGPGTDLTRLENWKASLMRPEAVFFCGAIPAADVSCFIRACDVVVIPSLLEGLPNLANEAQACGRPVLGTDAGGIPETVLHQETGYIVSKGDPEALASGFRWFYSNQCKIPDMGNNARKRMIEHFSVTSFKEKMFDFIMRVKNTENDYAKLT